MAVTARSPLAAIFARQSLLTSTPGTGVTRAQPSSGMTKRQSKQSEPPLIKQMGSICGSLPKSTTAGSSQRWRRAQRMDGSGSKLPSYTHETSLAERLAGKWRTAASDPPRRVGDRGGLLDLNSRATYETGPSGLGTDMNQCLADLMRGVEVLT